ncbi:MAG: hypothetical protein KAR47_16520, partial [Planctomycetes bacterium]|nr:hypothetical protein [Planctomycetota bacterium]
DSSAPSGSNYPDYIKRWTNNPAGWKLAGTKRMWGYGTLFDAQIVDNPKSFYCPSVPRKTQDRFRYDTYSNGHPWPWWDVEHAGSGGWEENVITSYYYIPQSKTKTLAVNGNGVSIDASKAALKATDLKPGSVLSSDLMAKSYFAHEIGNKRGVNAMFADGSVTYSHKSDIFGHEIFEAESVHYLPAVFRAVLKGLEGDSSYMDMIVLP